MKNFDSKPPASNFFTQVIITDIFANIMIVSQLSDAIPGFPTPGDVGKNLFEFFKPGNHEHPDQIREQLARGEQFSVIFYMKSISSLPEKIESFCYPMAGNDDGRSLATWVLKIARETSENNSFTDENKTYRDILNLITEAVYVQDEQGVFLDVNNAALELYKLNREDVIGKTPEFLAAPGKNDFKQLSLSIQNAFKGISDKFNFWGIKSTGEEFLKEVTLTSGKYYGKPVIIAVSRDITDKKLLLAEKENVIKELKKSEDQYRSISQMLRLMCDNVPDMIWAKDMNKQFIFTNKAICKNLLNAESTDEPTGKTDLFFALRERASHPNDPDYHTFGEICRDSDQIVMDTRKAQRFDEFGNVKSEFLFLDVYKAPFFNIEGEMIGTVGCGRDVTAERKLQQEHLQTEEELKAKTARMNAMISAIPEMLFVVDKHGIFVDYQASVEHRLLKPKDQIVGTSLQDVFDKEEVERQLQYYITCLQTGTQQSFNYQLQFDDETRHFEARISKMDDDHVLASVRDISTAVRMEAEIDQRARLQKILMNLATRFINIPFAEVEDEVNIALAEMGTFTKSDRVYIFDYDFVNDIQINTYEWCAEGVTPEIENLKAVPNSFVPDWVAAHLAGKSTIVERVSDLPLSSNLRMILEPQNIQSLVTIPLMHGGKCLGYIGFDAVKQVKTWTNDEIALLTLFAQLLTNLKIKSNFEGALIAKEEQFRTLLEELPDIVLIHQKGTIVYANKTALDAIGTELEHVKGKNILEFVVDEDQPKVIESMKLRNETGKIGDYEIHVKTNSGEIKDVIVRTTEIMFFGVESVITILIDITERKTSEALLLESEEKFRNLAKLSPFAIMIYQDEKFIYTNDAGERISGYTAEELFRMNYWEFVAPEHRDMIRTRGLQRQSGNEVPTGYEFRIISKNGEEHWVILNGALIEYKGKPAGLISVADITNLKKIEKELFIAKEKAEKSNKLKTAFINNISHEIRTPLNTIIGFSELMVNQESTQAEKTIYSNYLKQSSYRLIQTITDYMDSSIIVSGNQEVKPVNLFPEHIIKDLYDQFHEHVIAKNLGFTLNLHQGVTGISLSSDPELLKKILHHLLSNAVKFTIEGDIQIGAFIDDERFCIFVKDTGVGISQEARPFIFDHFSQEDQSSVRMFEGSGLGLSIARGLTELLGGKIWVESEKGSGSVFYLSLPLNDAEIKSSGESAKHIVEIDKKAKKRILLVEDDHYNYKFMMTLLARKNYAEVILATTGYEAIEKCRQHPEINLVLMDLKLPGMNGYEATRQIKSFRHDLPVIAITAYAMSGDETKAIEAGCNDYIAKPVNKEHLFAKIEKYYTD